jgi:hypothetical protein
MRYSLIVITADKKQADTQRYVITVIGIPSLTTSKVILFCVGISEIAKKKKKVRFIFQHSTRARAHFIYILQHNLVGTSPIW